MEQGQLTHKPSLLGKEPKPNEPCTSTENDLPGVPKFGGTLGGRRDQEVLST